MEFIALHLIHVSTVDVFGINKNGCGDMKEALLKGLTEEQIAKLKECKTKKASLQFIKLSQKRKTILDFSLCDHYSVGVNSSF